MCGSIFGWLFVRNEVMIIPHGATYLMKRAKPFIKMDLLAHIMCYWDFGNATNGPAM